MRDLALTMAVLVMMAPAASMPHIGVLVWSWIALGQPHREAFGFSTSLRLNLVVSVLTVLFWFFSREPKRFPLNGLTISLLFFTFWMIVSATTGFSWDRSYPMLDRYLKTMALMFVVMCIMTDRIRIHALLWIMAASLAFYAVKGGGFVLLTGGGDRVAGPAGTHIGDNNHLATALCMVLPLLHYLRMQSSHVLVRWGLLGAMAVTVFAILGTYSRGGFIGLAAMSAIFWWRSKRKIVSLALVAALGVLALGFMPEKFYQRMSTIETAATEDASFRGRLEAWQMAVNLANDRPLTGAGFVGYMDPNIFYRYNPEAGTVRAIHSIYFQLLAEMGYVGLFLFLLIAAIAVRYAFYVIATAKRHPELRWAGDLASMFIPSFAGYFVAGAALSFAYYDFYYVMLAVLCRLKILADQARAHALQPADAAASPAAGRRAA